MLEDPAPESLTPVGHGAVLQGPGEQDHVPGLPVRLHGVLVEVLLVVGIAGQLVGVGSECGGSVLGAEVGEESDKLDGERRGGVHDVGVAGGVVHLVVGVVEMGQLASCSWQDCVGSQARYLAVLTQHNVADVQDDGVLGELLEHLALVEECPGYAVEVIMLLVVVDTLGRWSEEKM